MALNMPNVHLQEEYEVLPAGLLEWSGHCVQEPAPILSLYVFAGHSEQEKIHKISVVLLTPLIVSPVETKWPKLSIPWASYSFETVVNIMIVIFLFGEHICSDSGSMVNLTHHEISP